MCSLSHLPSSCYVTVTPPFIMRCKLSHRPSSCYVTLTPPFIMLCKLSHHPSLKVIRNYGSSDQMDVSNMFDQFDTNLVSCSNILYTHHLSFFGILHLVGRSSFAAKNPKLHTFLRTCFQEELVFSFCICILPEIQ